MFGLTAIEVFLVIVAIFIVVYWITPQKFSWLPFLLITVLFAVLAFNITPYDSDDLSRYFKALNEMRVEGYDGLQRYIREDQFDFDTYRVAAYYVYFLSKLSNNHWLPFTTMFIVYGLGFYCIYKASVRFNVNKIHLFLASMFFISTYWYYDTVSGTRNGLAFAVAFACSYQHLVERKHFILCYIGYVLAALTHSAGILPVLLVIVTELTLNTSGKFLNFVFVFSISGGGVLIRYLSEVSDNDFIQSMAGKAENHGLGDSLETGTMFRVNITVLLIVTLLLIYVSYYFLNSDYTSSLKRLYKYASSTVYFMIGCMLSGLIFVRFARWILPLIGALLFMIGMQIQRNQINKEGLTKLTYYSPTKQSIRIKTRSVAYIIYVAYTAVHFWYLCNGSSLYWIMF